LHHGDTIIAPASAPGRSPRAIIRISGHATGRLLRSLTGEDHASRRCSTALLHLAPGVQLPILIARFLAPNSYTGEDAAELQVPGNPDLVERLLHLLASYPGVRLAHPGEFTARAYLAGRMTIDQAEGVAATIAATTSEQLAAAASLLEGRTGAHYRRFSDELANLLSLVEAGIDFTDQEDVVAITPGALASRLASLADQIAAHLGAAAGAESAPPIPRVVLAGKPNAGKSTLFNALLRRRRAVASPTPGTTRDVLSEEFDLCSAIPGGPTILLQDLAGLDASATGLIESSAQHAAAAALRSADVILWCDPTGRFNPAALPVTLPPVPTIRVRTFGDQPRAAHTAEDLAVCALDGWNLSVLRRAIADASTTARAGSIAALLPRHRRALSEAGARIAEAAAMIDPSALDGRLDAPELIAGLLRAALDSLGELVGHISPDDILGRVFATFCIGK